MAEPLIIVFDPAEDLANAQLCNCAVCCDAYWDAVEATAFFIIQNRGLTHEVLRCAYDSPTAMEIRKVQTLEQRQRERALWMQVQYDMGWSPDDRPADCETRK